MTSQKTRCIRIAMVMLCAVLAGACTKGNGASTTADKPNSSGGAQVGSGGGVSLRGGNEFNHAGKTGRGRHKANGTAVGMETPPAHSRNRKIPTCGSSHVGPAIKGYK